MIFFRQIRIFLLTVLETGVKFIGPLTLLSRQKKDEIKPFKILSATQHLLI